MTTEKQFWWCGWEVPNHVPNEGMALKWPKSMTGWLTGSGCTYTGSGFAYTTGAGVVWAENAEEAWKTVLSCFKEPHCDTILERWGPLAQGQKVETSDRFPHEGFDLLKEESSEYKGFELL